MPTSDRPCRAPGCPYPAMKGKRKCGWHWLADQPMETQARAASSRLSKAAGPRRSRVSQAPPGCRWCSGCQSFVPLFYTRGSRCLADARAAARASHVARTYSITAAEELALSAWQSGRCFVCGRKAKTRSLAVDHDHETGEVRGLLCSDDKYGCNVLLRRILGDPAAAARLLAYTERTPLERMRAGEPAWQFSEPVEDIGVPPF